MILAKLVHEFLVGPLEKCSGFNFLLIRLKNLRMTSNFFKFVPRCMQIIVILGIYVLAFFCRLEYPVERVVINYDFLSRRVQHYSEICLIHPVEQLQERNFPSINRGKTGECRKISLILLSEHLKYRNLITTSI